MKAFIMGLVLLTSISAFAKSYNTPAHVCGAVSTGRINVECKEVIKDGQFQECAVDSCLLVARRGDEHLALSCVKIIKNKSFDKESCESCYGKNSNDTVTCLKYNGK